MAAIYRVQEGGKVRMSTVPAAHEGLGVASYAWASSPLRRYVDLVNQRQLIALARGETPPYRASDERLLAAMRDFESAHEAYGEFQRQMERYWCLRWLIQENAGTAAATVIRESLVRFDELPLVVRVPSLPPLDAGQPGRARRHGHRPPGTHAALRIPPAAGARDPGGWSGKLTAPAPSCIPRFNFKFQRQPTVIKSLSMQ